ncbi:LysR family transcriptional regulator [Sulfitobacter sp. HNIBRBA3233]|uniref:LysR family transcriptional regulator n=1 Tax=Sulfitobacter marinivivus TaxID=3158558 RepID=UPI0032DEC74D
MSDLSAFDLNLLRVLDALLRDHSTLKAGTRLGLSQPAVSAALGRLRTALGDELFFRKGQGLAPTQFALSLEEPLREILEAVADLIRRSDDFDPAGATSDFRLSGSDFFAELLMPALADRIQTLAPAMRVHLVDLVADSHLDTLERFKVDLALIPRTEKPKWLQSRTVFHSTFVVVARKDHPKIGGAGLSSGDTVPLDLFCALGHVLFSPEGQNRAMGDAALERIGRKRRVVMTLPVFSGVYRAVAGSDLIALLPSALAHRVAADAGLEVYRPPMPVPTATLEMVWHRKFSSDPAHTWLRNQIAALLAPLDEKPKTAGRA